MATTVLALAPASFNLDPVPGSFPLRSDIRQLGVYLKHKLSSKLSVRPADLPSLMDCDKFGAEYEQDKVDLLGLALRLVGKFAEMQKDLVAFVEVFEPFYEIVFALGATKVPASIKVSRLNVTASVPMLYPADLISSRFVGHLRRGE